MSAKQTRNSRSKIQVGRPESILAEADRLVSGERGADYGHPLDDYTRTANAFNALTGHRLTAEDAITFMVCVKLSREQHKRKRDNLVDAAGYLKCLKLALEERQRREALANPLREAAMRLDQHIKKLRERAPQTKD